MGKYIERTGQQLNVLVEINNGIFMETDTESMDQQLNGRMGIMNVIFTEENYLKQNLLTFLLNII
jgi:hypothetical protein